MHIDGMDRSTCATVIEHALGRIERVLEASVSYAAERLRLEFDSKQVSRKAIVLRLEALGYGVLEPHHKAAWHVAYRELIVSAVAGALLLAGWQRALLPWGNGPKARCCWCCSAWAVDR